MPAAQAGVTTTRATLAEVAERAGVSVSTVSKVLNGRAGVSEETRAKIEALLSDHQYNPRNPGPNHAPLIEVLCYEIDSWWSSEALASIEGVARRRGVGVVVSGTSDRQKPDVGWIEGVLNRRPVGAVLVSSNVQAAQLQQLRSRNIPFVMLGPTGDVPPDVPTIGSADWSGAYAAAQHLIGLGHREIAIVTGPEDMMAATARLSGFRAALEAAGLTLRKEHLRRAEFHHTDGIEQGRLLLSQQRRPTAVFAASDVLALGVYEAARALGVAIPSQLSVVGFDDVKVAQWAGPALTTVRVPIAEMAARAVELVLDVRDGPVDASRIDMATTLVVRGSTGPPQATKVSKSRQKLDEGIARK